MLRNLGRYLAGGVLEVIAVVFLVVGLAFLHQVPLRHAYLVAAFGFLTFLITRVLRRRRRRRNQWRRNPWESEGPRDHETHGTGRKLSVLARLLATTWIWVLACVYAVQSLQLGAVGTWMAVGFVLLGCFGIRRELYTLRGKLRLVLFVLVLCADILANMPWNGFGDILGVVAALVAGACLWNFIACLAPSPRKESGDHDSEDDPWDYDEPKDKWYTKAWRAVTGLNALVAIASLAAAVILLASTAGFCMVFGRCGGSWLRFDALQYGLAAVAGVLLIWVQTKLQTAVAVRTDARAIVVLVGLTAPAARLAQMVVQTMDGSLDGIDFHDLRWVGLTTILIAGIWVLDRCIPFAKPATGRSRSDRPATRRAPSDKPETGDVGDTTQPLPAPRRPGDDLDDDSGHDDPDESGGSPWAKPR
jgi:hypothetical protein